MKSNVFFVVTVTGLDKESEVFREQLTSFVFDHFECSGVQDYSIDEKRVDEILGERAYSGGDVPDEVVDEVTGQAQADEGSTLIFFFDQDMAQDEAARCHQSLLEKYPKLGITKEEKKVEDWDAQWRLHYKPIHVSSELSIIPEWEMPEAKKDNEVYIYPGQGFGTGGHETTFLCLKLFLDIEKVELEGKSCLDFGCGSGILGIAAIKLRKMYLDFCDIDKSALENTLQNIELNLNSKQQDGHRLVIRDRFQSEGPYHLVFANILKPVLISEKPVMIEQLVKGGYLIISGLLNEQVEEVIRHYQEFKVLKTLSKGDWSAALLVRES